ncbi:hypothetical protein V1291_002170 [Nitrobacteraceae bacterium AZCC 1564]
MAWTVVYKLGPGKGLLFRQALALKPSYKAAPSGP